MTGGLPRLLLLLLAAVAAVQAILLVRFEINWDEFLNLSMVYDHRRGELREVLQTAFVHLFPWVSSVSQNEVHQVIAARIVIAAFALTTSWAIWASARRLSSPAAALFAVFVYWSFSYVMQHGLALRTDTLAAAPIMVALWLVLTRGDQKRMVVLAGLALGFAGAMTIKAVFFVPTLAIIAFLRAAEGRDWRSGAVSVMLAGVASIAAFAAVIGLHVLTFDTFANPIAFLGRTTQATLSDTNRSVFLTYAAYSVIENPGFYLLLIVTVVAVVRMMTVRVQRVQGAIALALLLPLLIPFFYRDMFPYFYAMVLPPIVVAMSMGFEVILRQPSWRNLVVLMVLFIVAWGASLYAAFSQTNAHQAAILRVIHDRFPAGSHYIDGRTMVSSFQKEGLFMSGWGMSDYRAAGVPVMAEVLRNTPPAFLLANNPALYLDEITPHDSEASPVGLLAADVRTLQGNFVPFWGPIWVPGHRIAAGDAGIETFAAGTYINQGPGTVEIAGRMVQPGGTIALDEGVHPVVAGANATLSLAIEAPAESPPARPIFSGFLWRYLSKPE